MNYNFEGFNNNVQGFLQVLGGKRLFKVAAVLAALLAFSMPLKASDSLSLSSQQPSRSNLVSGNEYDDGKVRHTPKKGDKATYIVRMADPSTARYTGGIDGMAATSNDVTGQLRLNTNSLEAREYGDYLKAKQDGLIEHCERAFNRRLDVKYRYKHALNGFSVVLSEKEAEGMSRQPNVISVTREQSYRPTTDVGPAWIGAPKLWAGKPYLGIRGSMGEGAVVAILDTGINHDHASFADIGGDGYDHINPLGSGNYIPGSHCDRNPDFCNDKLIGAWNMVQSPDDPNSPEDSDGHGSHTASTVAGNVIPAAVIEAPTTRLSREISGVAPHANIIAYDVCIFNCPGAALIAAVEQVIIDAAALPNGIQALNYSISGGNSPYSDAVELGFLNATAAGIFVSASAGNSGPGAGTVAHNSPWVSTVAAMTHNRTISNSVVEMSSDADPLANIVGAGFTAAYGPVAIVYAGDFPTANGSSNDTEPEQCLEPFPPGHFNGEIVVCDRGTIARVGKGQNVLAGGAGGLVLANAEANGESVVGDAHFLPAVHIGFTDGSALKAWIAANTNTVGSISGYQFDLSKSNGDVMAAFSSRGPNLALDILKPDVGAPGVSILAAVNTPDGSTNDEYGFISGTSMSSPHNAGSGALVSMLTDWNPYEIKSAMMMTAKRKPMFKEDGETQTDPFDVGAGRINLKRVLHSGLVLNETPENFLAANPELGGDPKTLNIASMMDSNCVGKCSWTRTVRNTNQWGSFYKVFAGSPGNDMKLKVWPRYLWLGAGDSADINISADTTLAENDWNFGELHLHPWGRHLANLHMPVAVHAATSSSPNLSKTVDKTEAVKGDILTYEINVSNGLITDTISLHDKLPHGLSYVDGSASGVLANGAEVSPVSVSGKEVSWSFTLDPGTLEVVPSVAPFGYFPMAWLGVTPAGCPSNCDDGAFIYSGLPAFEFNGNSYTEIIMSVNGTIEAGSASGFASSAANQNLPDPAGPNNLMAPFWTDLNLGDGGQWYAAVVTAGPDTYIVLEWEAVPRFGDPTVYSFQVWIQAGTSNIWYVYANIPAIPSNNLTVGVENDNGTTGASAYFNGVGTAPEPGADLAVEAGTGGTATLTFQAELKRCFSWWGEYGSGKKKVNRVDMTSGDIAENAIAVTTCSHRPHGDLDEDSDDD